MSKAYLWLIFGLDLALFSIYSYSQVEPNLVFSSNRFFWGFQQAAWVVGLQHRLWSTLIYLTLTVTLFWIFRLMLKQFKQGAWKMKELILVLITGTLVLLPSFPALSLDVFNYLMNGKIVGFYHTSPYRHATWDFPQEPWLSFMHNIHTVTPYGVVWTGISTLIYYLSGGDLQGGMFLYRLLSITAIITIGGCIYHLVKTDKVYKTAFFVLNPLVFLEGTNSMHNDLVMMMFFMIGLYLMARFRKLQPRLAGALLCGFWLISILTKLVTVIAPGIYLIWRLLGYFKLKLSYFTLLTLGLILIFFWDGSHRYFSWYLLWPLAIAPLSTNPKIHQLLGLFSLTGMLSYAVYLATGTYTESLLLYRNLIFFSLPLLSIIAWSILPLKNWVYRENR